jgi:hypothetical protein
MKLILKECHFIHHYIYGMGKIVFIQHKLQLFSRPINLVDFFVIHFSRGTLRQTVNAVYVASALVEFDPLESPSYRVGLKEWGQCRNS